MSWLAQKPILALAPMADMTDGPFCRICREVTRGVIARSPASQCGINSATKQSRRHLEDIGIATPPTGARNDNFDFVIFREMISAEAIVRGNAKTLKMCEFEKKERSVIIQLFGGRADTIARAAKIVVKKFKPDGVDINMGCPVPKLTGKVGAGAALLKDIPRAVAIIKALKEAKLGVPISVKTRLGWQKPDEILDFAPKLEAAGADLISIHGRTKNQGYSGSANWEMIARVKKILTIPVLANGDIKTSADIKKCLAVTGADGVMIGRGALGNPWILKNIQYPISNIPTEELRSVILKHARYHLKRYGLKSIVTFRKHLAWYVNGDRWPNIKNIKELRSKLVRVSSLEELKKILLSFRTPKG